MSMHSLPFRSPGRFAAALVLALWPGACASQQGDGATPVSQAWQRSRQQRDLLDETPAAGGEAAASAEPLARVNGQPISRQQVVRLLLAGRGVAVLDEVIVLELVRRQAEQEGLTVSGGDLEAEYDRALRSLLTTLPSADPAAFDREAAERVLDEILTSRGISRQEYRLGMLRNAYLRKLARADLRITDEQLRAEYERAYGRRVRVRHIQLLGGVDVAEVQRLITAGQDFADLARRYSANAATGPGGGLLRPFSRDDPDVPALLRETAFGLAAGQVSNPIRIDNWRHVIKVEEHLPAQALPLEEVRHELETRLRRRLIDPQMRRISAELFGAARVEIADPTLAADFFEQHPELGRSDR